MTDFTRDIETDLYTLLVRRGYAQHEAYAISHGTKLAKICTRDCNSLAHPWHPLDQECVICGTPRTRT